MFRCYWKWYKGVVWNVAGDEKGSYRDLWGAALSGSGGSASSPTNNKDQVLLRTVGGVAARNLETIGNNAAVKKEIGNSIKTM